MLKDIIDVKPLHDQWVYLRFEDGAEGKVNLAELIEFRGVFAQLSDPAYFAQVRVHPELGTIYWPNDADLDPDVLYSIVTEEPLPVLALA